MSLAPNKTRWWFVLAAGLSSLVMFTALCIQFGFPRGGQPLVVIWPFASMGLLGLGGWRLRELYRLEPAQRGGWQISLGDLLCIMFLLGLELAIFQIVAPDKLATFGAAVSLLSAGLLLFGFLAATRAGYARSTARVLYALGTVARLYGFLGLGLLTFLTALIFFSDIRNIVTMFDDVFLFENRHSPDWFVYMLRAGWICYVISFAFLRLASRLKPASAPSAYTPP